MTTVAAIGLGDLGRKELQLYREMDGVEVVAGADVVSEARETFESEFQVPAYESYQELLETHTPELDAVNIVTPHTLHYEQTRACFDHGLDVFLEKPMVTDIAEAKRLIETAESQELVFQIGYQRHFHPAYQRIKRIIEKGDIGTVHSVSCYLGQEWINRFAETWRATPELSGGGQLYDSGSHLLDTLLWTTGTRPRQVAALMDHRDHDVDVNTALAAILQKQGRTITASISVTADGTSTSGTEEGLYIWGTEGRLAYDKSGLTVYDKGEGDEDTSRSIPLKEDPGFMELADQKLSSFIAAVRGEQDVAVPGTYGLQVTAFTEAAYLAHERGETIDVMELLEQPSEYPSSEIKQA